MLIHWTLPALVLVAGIAACALVGPPPSSRDAALCPEPKHYTTEQEKRAAAELLALAPDSVLGAMITDYARERAELRACRMN